MKLEEKTFTRNLKGIEKGLEISGFGIVKYSVRSESGHMVALRDKTYYILGLPNYLRIISPQGIRTSEVYKGTFISHCHNEHDIYADIDLKEDNPGWQKPKPIKRVCVKNGPKNNLPTHEAALHNQIEK